MIFFPEAHRGLDRAISWGKHTFSILAFNIECLLTEQPVLLYIYNINFHDSRNIRMT